MAGSQLRLTTVAIALMAVAACHCDDRFLPLSQTTLTIVSPQNNASYGAGQSFTFEATASNALGISSLALYAGASSGVACQQATDCSTGQVCDLLDRCIGALLKTCTGTAGKPSLSCSVTVPVDTYRALIVLGQITLTAIAVDEKQETAHASVTIDVKPLTIVFTAPTPTAGSNPPVADVSGVSPVAVAVTSSIPLASVTIKSETGVALGSWLNDPTGSMFSQSVDWGLTLGAGMHRLIATARDVEGNVSSALLDVQVGTPTIQFTMPTITPGTSPAVADVAGTSPVAVEVTSAIPLAEVVITYDNGLPLASWPNNPTGTTFQQTVDWPGKLGPGLHHLTAAATTVDLERATATLDVMVGLPSIHFTKPVPASGSNIAEVAGTSPVAVKVSTPVPLTLTSVIIVTDSGNTLAEWNNNPTGTTFQQSVNWEPVIGAGTHTLTATGTWSDGETATATLEVSIGSPSIQFTMPAITPGTNPTAANVSGVGPVAVEVMTPNGLTLSSVDITAENGTSIGQWGPNPVGTTFQQMIDWATVLGTGTHTLTAKGAWSDGETATATLVINVAGASISFTEPTITPGTSPAAADVSGTSPVAVAVVTPTGVTLSSVVITSDNGATIGNWSPNPTGTAFQQSVNWTAVVGSGMHTLTATGKWSDGEMATATLDVNVGAPMISFTQPALTAGTNPAVADVSGVSPVAVATVTPGNLTLSSVLITADNGATLGTWTPNPTGSTFQQNVDWATQVGLGMHLLTATGSWSDGETAHAMLVVQVGGPTIQFTAPMITAGTNPAVADVSGSSPVAVAVGTPPGLILASVVIVSDNGATIASWSPNPTGSAFSQTIAWATAVGTGTHLLTATATWTDTETAKATLTVNVAKPPCASDADCQSGYRCCTNDGTCNPIVAAGGDCDCTHPCPTNQGCFPGICGATPSQCRPGCNPGSHSGAGQLPAACNPVNGQPSFCNPLPADQVTAQNMGGACQLGDNCSVTAQNCPAMPLDRAKPVSATNPIVPYSCIPFAPNLNGCYPAGGLAAGAPNCTQYCGGNENPDGASQGMISATNCAVGLECVQAIGPNGPLGPPACLAQCGNPSTNNSVSNQCPAGSNDSCEQVYEPFGSAHQVNFTTGSCCAALGEPCTVAEPFFCCSDYCSAGGKCCLPRGLGCARNADCCSGSCGFFGCN
jgi:hypothetical protein